MAGSNRHWIKATPILTFFATFAHNRLLCLLNELVFHGSWSSRACQNGHNMRFHRAEVDFFAEFEPLLIHDDRILRLRNDRILAHG